MMIFHMILHNGWMSGGISSCPTSHQCSERVRGPGWARWMERAEVRVSGRSFLWRCYEKWWASWSYKLRFPSIYLDRIYIVHYSTYHLVRYGILMNIRMIFTSPDLSASFLQVITKDWACDQKWMGLQASPDCDLWWLITQHRYYNN